MYFVHLLVCDDNDNVRSNVFMSHRYTTNTHTQRTTINDSNGNDVCEDVLLIYIIYFSFSFFFFTFGNTIRPMGSRASSDI